MKDVKIAVVCCLHGNERYGLEVVKQLPSSLSYFIANKKALKENKRFIDTDLNRCFPGKLNGNHEEKLAFYLKDTLKEFDIVIDLHSSSVNIPLFGIITKPNKEKIKLVKKLGLKKLVIMHNSFAKGNSLIDFVKCGISLEVGNHERKENVSEVLVLINRLISSCNNQNNILNNNSLEIYEVFDVVKGEKNVEFFMENFKEVKEGDLIARGKKDYYSEYDFFPVLVGEDAYQDVLCLAAKQVNFKSRSFLT